MKKIFSVILCFVLICSLSVTNVFAETGFTDLKGNRYATAIEELNELDVVHGFTATKFGPDSTLTRAQAATIFVNALYSKSVVPYVINFNDVYTNTWCYDAINTAVYYDIVHGFSDGTFRPNDAINFNQMTAMVLNTLGYDVTALAGTWPSNIQSLATKLGLYKNLAFTDGTATITRGEACQMIYNALHVEIVKIQNGKFVSTGKTLYEAMGFKYEVVEPETPITSPATPSTDGVIVGPTPSGFEPVVQSGQYWGCVAFVEVYTNNAGKVGFEIIFEGDPTVYRFAGTYVTYYFVQPDGKVISDSLNLYDEETGEISIQRGDELWFEMTLPNSSVYKILSWNEPPYDPNNATYPNGGSMDSGFGV